MDKTSLEIGTVGRNLYRPFDQETEVEELRAGSGGCRSCRCRGFRSKPEKDNYCAECGHHWNNHA